MIINAVWIISFALLILSFLGIVFISKFLTESFDSIKFSFYRVFPFEVKKHTGKYGNFYISTLYLFSFCCFSSIFFVASSNTKLDSLKALSIMTCCVLGLAAVAFTFINLFEVIHIKVHLGLFVAFIALTILGILLVFARGLVGYKTYLEHAEKTAGFIISMSISVVLIVVVFLIIFNPKLANWARLDKVEGQEDVYVRPLKFPLAYSEWAIFLILFIIVVNFYFQLTM